jgi:hypothetical protein
MEIPDSVMGETTSPSISEPTTPTSPKRKFRTAFTPRQDRTDSQSTISQLTSITNNLRFKNVTEEQKRRIAYTLLLQLCGPGMTIRDILRDAENIIPTIVSDELPGSLTPSSSILDALSPRINSEDEQEAVQVLDILLDERQRRTKNDGKRMICKKRKGNKGDVIQESFSDEEQDELFPSSIFEDRVENLIVDPDHDQQLENITTGDKSNTPLTRSI